MNADGDRSEQPCTDTRCDAQTHAPGGRSVTAQREVITHDDPDASLCTIEGTEHDYRLHAYASGRNHLSLRCVWCHAVSCGDPGEVDPCIEPYHHTVPHRSNAGVTWPLGGDRKETP